MRRLSDTLCIENGLSIVEDPKPKGQTYDKWLGTQAKPSHRERLRQAIDKARERGPEDLEALVKLLPEALAMLEKYKDPTRPTLLPPQEFRVLRGNMKSLRVLSGISMDLVYHVGRHSFASLVTLEEGVPIETISRMLGHNNIQTTQIYARVTPKKLFEDMDKFIEANKDFMFVL